MAEEAPKLYANKPKKAQLKKTLESLSQSSSSPATAASNSATAAATSYKMGTPPPPPPPPPQPPKESFARRYKFLWPLLLTVNLMVGAYLFMRTNKKSPSTEEEGTSNAPSTPAQTASTVTAPVTEGTVSLPPAQPMRFQDPIREDQQRELFKWLLEEKRKVKPKDPQEKKQLDEEKAILKQFIRAKSIPSL